MAVLPLPLISQYIDEDFRVQHLKKLFLFCEIMVPEQSKKVKKNEEKKKKEASEGHFWMI